MSNLKVIAFPAPSGSGIWRLADPFKYLRRLGVDARLSDEGITEEAAEWADIYVLENCVNKDGIALLYEYQQEHGKKIVVDADDLMDLNPDNPHQKEHDVYGAKYVVHKTFEIADMITTTNDYLAEKLRKFNRNVVVLPNYPDLERWVKPQRHNTSNCIRIGWAGSITHLNDLKSIERPLKQILKEFKATLVLVGDTRFGELFSDYHVEPMLAVPFDCWPDKLHGLALDIALAPLVDNEFNRCKSKIKFYEYALAGYPGVYSPTVYYDRMFDGNFGMIAYDEGHWYRAIKNLILFPQLRHDIKLGAEGYVTARCSLEKHAHEWLDAYNSLKPKI